MEVHKHKDSMESKSSNTAQKFVKNTFETEGSKHDTDADPEEAFKTQRQKYLEQRRGRKKQIKNIRKKQFGSSSSESEQQIVRQKPQPTLTKVSQKPENQEVSLQKQVHVEDEEQMFKNRRRAWMEEQAKRKKIMMEEKKKRWGASSSDSSSDEDVPPKAKKQRVPAEDSPKSGKNFKAQSQSYERTKETVNKEAKKPVKIVYSQPNYVKQPPNDTKKLTVMVQSKKNLNWIEETLVIENKKLRFLSQNVEFMSAYISKIKLFFSRAASSKQYYKMKVTHKNEDFFFAVSNERLVEDVPEYYYVFARVVQDKLSLLGIEPKKMDPMSMPNVMNIKDVPENIRSSSVLFGNILKKSQVLGNWETRFVAIGSKGITSSKKPTEKPSMTITSESIKELWTRFDVEENTMLNLKIMYSSTKTEFGIPLSAYTDDCNWLFCFYKAIMQKK